MLNLNATPVYERVFVCVCHVQTCPSALPPSLFPPNMMSRLSLLLISHFLWSNGVFEGELVFTHTPTKPGRERERECVWGEDIQFDKDQSCCLLCPVGHILLRKLLRRNTGRPASHWHIHTFSHTYTVIWKLVLCAGDTGSEYLRAYQCAEWPSPAGGRLEGLCGSFIIRALVEEIRFSAERGDQRKLFL